MTQVLTTTASRALTGARRRAGLLVRSRIAGDDAAERHQQIWHSPGQRWNAPDSAICVVHGDASMFAAGLTALLLQSLHPLAMAGVADHSDYRSDPWGRLQRTSQFIATTTFGTVADASELIRAINGVHRTVVGHDHRGRPYDARDPHLLRWVHVAEIWSFLECHRLYGRTTLSPERRDEYVRQASRTGLMLGAKDVPVTVAELREALEAYRPELEASPAALDARRFLLGGPPLEWTDKPAYSLLREGAVAALPAWARHTLELPDGPLGSRLLAEHLGRTGVATLRWVLDAVEG
ncbi:oxygenase MpaB family protein [Rhodococcus sp. IEGM 1408]|uniref:oxygenase MpaB family protein n=1 Tax=Rhodococcus sp. IEGM 1408 TaxID=3082220 RepID=UPI0029548502|nr:oxygenase MpaB family protein [Rhodococcus sp. IEGM 1408]MDV8000634.1 oxygenase MpaB family protein [Rhodococcus sp. IEGM 1408]